MQEGDARCHDQKKQSEELMVRVGAFVIRDVLFPRRYETIERVRALGHEAVSLHGRLGHPDDYPLPRGFGRHKHLVPLYRYFLARQLAGLG
ncbi:MAG: hypothetical protein ACOYU7_02295 [Bacillota bacterium]